jgi:hypothetical protein
MASIGGGILTRETEVFGVQASNSATLTKQIPYRLTWDQTRTYLVGARSLPYSTSSDRQLIQQPQKHESGLLRTARRQSTKASLHKL